MALSVAGGWETEMGVLRASWWRVPCLSPHSDASPARPVLYKCSRLSVSLLSSPPCITKGLQMVRLSGSLPHKSVGFVSPFSLPTYICRSQILFQARGRKDALGPWMGLAALSGQWHWEATFYMRVASQACPGPFSFQGHPEPDVSTTACLSWGLKQDVSRFAIHRNCLGWI